jgi:hypothetical protein
MPITLEGSCRCGGVSFTVLSHTPYPYQLCYCSICRKTAGGGGYAINLMGTAESVTVRGKPAIYQAELEEEGADGVCRLQTSPARRHFCARCASALWLFDPRWPELVHPFASAIDSELPMPPSRVHLMLRYKPGWVVPRIGPNDQVFDEYPEQSIEDWHKSRGLWLE